MIDLFVSSLSRHNAKGVTPPTEPEEPGIDEYTTSNNEHVFWVVGDSIGNGTNARTNEPTPDPLGSLKEWDGSSASVVLDTATANDGSQYPQFALTYKQATGKGVILCEDALGGAEFYYSNNASHWNTDGSLYAPAKAKAQAMLAHYNIKLKGVILILGINDARGTATMTNIQSGMNSLINRLNADFNTPAIYIVQIGREESGFTTRVRDVQKLIDNTDTGYTYGLGLVQRYANVYLADNLERYVGLGLYSGDNLHLSQLGNNELGQTLAEYIAG